MSLKNKKAILAVLLASTIPYAAFAQVPSGNGRPGLSISQPSYQPYQASPPTATLVQRNYDPNNAQAGQGYPAPQSPPRQDDLFYIEDGSQAPDNLAGGLSDYNSQRMTQAGQQLRGDYGAISQSGMPAGMVQDAWRRPFDNMSQGQSAPGTIRYQWSSDLVMPIRLRAGMITSIVLPEWEAAQDVAIGDDSAVAASILRPNQIAVKSMQTGLDTSLNVVGGSGNVYTFYLRTEGRNTTLITDLQVFVQASPSKGNDDWFSDEKRNIYTPQARAAAVGGGENDISLPASASQGDEPVPTDRRIFNLKMFEVNKGDRIIAPEYVYTDGRFTYLHFPAGMTDRPAVFRVVDGVEGRVNTRVTGRHSQVVVVEALGDFVLRNGTRAVCIKQVDGEDQVVSRH